MDYVCRVEMDAEAVECVRKLTEAVDSMREMLAAPEVPEGLPEVVDRFVELVDLLIGRLKAFDPEAGSTPGA
jgi:hypothetical protein